MINFLIPLVPMNITSNNIKVFHQIFVFECKKFISNKYVLLLSIIYFLTIFFLLIILSNIFNSSFISTYFRWVNISDDKNLFQYFIAKSRFINIILLSIIIPISGYFIFSKEYKLGTIHIINKSPINIYFFLFAKALLFFFFLLLIFLLYLGGIIILKEIAFHLHPLVIKYDDPYYVLDYILTPLFFLLCAIRNSLFYTLISKWVKFNNIILCVTFGLYIYFCFSEYSFFINSLLTKNKVSSIIFVQFLYSISFIVLIIFFYSKKKYGMVKI